MIISPVDLKYFMEVSQTKNLSRAAERIGITQPSLTLAIQRVEESLGTKVLIRTKKGVFLTQAGKQLLRHSKVLMQYWDKLRSEAISSVDEIKGHLSLGCHPSVGLYTLEKFLPHVFEQYPEIEITLKHGLSRNISEQVISLELDVGLVINPVKHPDLVIHNIGEDVVTLWTNNSNRKTIDYKKGEAILICDPELIQTQSLLKKIKAKGIKFSRIITSSSLENITNLVTHGAGIGIIPGRIVNKMAPGILKPVPNAPVFKDILSVIYRVENKGVKSLQYLVGEIVKSVH